VITVSDAPNNVLTGVKIFQLFKKKSDLMPTGIGRAIA